MLTALEPELLACFAFLDLVFKAPNQFEDGCLKSMIPGCGVNIGSWHGQGRGGGKCRGGQGSERGSDDVRGGFYHVAALHALLPAAAAYRKIKRLNE